MMEKSTLDLPDAVDAVNDAYFFGNTLSDTERTRLARFIASFQGLPGSYAGMFGINSAELADGIHVFTGEKITSGAACANILGEEACRALQLLAVDDPVVQLAYARANAGISARIASGEVNSLEPAGRFCCGRCSCAYWRHLAVGGIGDSERRLRAGMINLNALRLSNGEWRTFPFWYTLAAVSEVDLPAATAELRYAAPSIEKRITRLVGKEPFVSRRRAIAIKILAKL